ncbi:MAG: hypothetical protein ABL986_07945 [Vicinamibacterales bacterium]
MPVSIPPVPQVAEIGAYPNPGHTVEFSLANGLTMYPCDTFVASIYIKASTSGPTEQWYKLETLRTRNGAYESVFTRYLKVDGNSYQTIPLWDTGLYGSTINGTRDPSQIVTAVRITSWDVDSGFLYRWSLSVSPRKDPLKPFQTYNVGSLLFNSATIGGIEDDALIRFSMTNAFTADQPGMNGRRQYHRFTLGPGGTFSLIGTVQNAYESGALGATLNAHLMDDVGGSLGQVGFAWVGAKSTSALTLNGTVTNTGTTPKDYILRFTTDGDIPIADATLTVALTGAYVVNASCQPGFLDPPWTDTRTIAIDSGINADDRATIIEGIDKWNTKLSELGIGVVFNVITTGSANITVEPSTTVSGGLWEATPGLPPEGYGKVKIQTSRLGQGLGNLVQHILMHEFGHVLRMWHVNPTVPPFNSVTPACTWFDSLMFLDPNNTNQAAGPFPGITSNETSALTGHWFP